MKKTDFSNIALKIEASPRFNLHNQEAFIDRIGSLISVLCAGSPGIVKLFGAEVSIIGSDYTITAGVIYYQGELYTIDGATVTIAGGETAVFQPLKDYTRKAWYGDGTQKDTFYENKMELVSGASGSGIADYNDTVTFDERVKVFLNQKHEIINDVQLRTKIIPIGDWNMDLNTNKDIDISALALNISKIRHMSAVIRPDSDETQLFIQLPAIGIDGVVIAQVQQANSSLLRLSRLDAGPFDSTAYDETSYNRGNVTITYEL